MDVNFVKLGLTPIQLLMDALKNGMPPEMSDGFCRRFEATLGEFHSAPFEIAIRMDNGKITLVGDGPSKTAMYVLLSLAEEALSREIRGDVKKDTTGLLNLTAASAVAVATDIKKLQVSIVHRHPLPEKKNA